VHGYEPIHKWQFRAVHHRAASERSPVATMLALVLLLALQPHYIVRAAMLTRHTLFVSHFLETPATSRFIREILVKFKDFHIITIL
jgi:hypothetical protein